MKVENTPRLETDRLILRRFTMDDVDDMLIIYGDEEVNRFLPWFPNRTRESIVNLLESDIFPTYEKPVGFRYAIEWKETGRVIGYVSINYINEAEGSGDLGYGLSKAYWGRGIVTEASRAVLDRAHENGFRFITAAHDVNNPGSGRVMQKVGMTYRRSFDELWQPKNFMVTFNLYQIDF